MKVPIRIDYDDCRRISAPCAGCGKKITVQWPSVAAGGRPPMSPADRPVQEKCSNCGAWFLYAMYERDADFWSTPSYAHKATVAVAGSFEEQQLTSGFEVLDLMRQCLIQHPHLRVGQLLDNMTAPVADVFYVTNATLRDRLSIMLQCYHLREKEDR